MTAFGVHTHRHLHRRASLQMSSLGEAQSPQPDFSEFHRPFSRRFPAQTTQHVLLNTYYVLAVGLSTILRVRTSSVALIRTLSFSRGKRPVRPWGHSLGSPCASLSSRSQLSSPEPSRKTGHSEGQGGEIGSHPISSGCFCSQGATSPSLCLGLASR